MTKIVKAKTIGGKVLGESSVLGYQDPTLLNAGKGLEDDDNSQYFTQLKTLFYSKFYSIMECREFFITNATFNPSR